MGSNQPLTYHSNYCQLRVNSKILAQDLINLGCLPRKSLILEFPNIPPQYLSHFIRGFFDGDGSITFNKPNTIKVSFISTDQFIKSLQKALNNVLGLKIGPLQKHGKVRVALYYSDDARKLCNWLYKDPKGLYLSRKKDRFERHIKLRKNG